MVDTRERGRGVQAHGCHRGLRRRVQSVKRGGSTTLLDSSCSTRCQSTVEGGTMDAPRSQALRALTRPAGSASYSLESRVRVLHCSLQDKEQI